MATGSAEVELSAGSRMFIFSEFPTFKWCRHIFDLAAHLYGIWHVASRLLQPAEQLRLHSQINELDKGKLLLGLSLLLTREFLIQIWDCLPNARLKVPPQFNGIMRNAIGFNLSRIEMVLSRSTVLTPPPPPRPPITSLFTFCSPLLPLYAGQCCRYWQHWAVLSYLHQGRR